MKKQSYEQEMSRGLLLLAVLQALSARRMYASEIIQSLKETAYATQEGTLYPLLSKMKREGMVLYEWAESESGPPRKYYNLSASGEKLRVELLAAQKSMTQEITRLGVKQ